MMEIPLQICRRCKQSKEIFHFKMQKRKHGPPYPSTMCRECSKQTKGKTLLDKLRQNEMLTSPWKKK